MTTIEGVKGALGEFVDDFTVELQGDVVVVKAKHFVAKEEWDKVNNALRGLGGKWTSMGKASHWRVPVSHAVNGSHVGVKERLKQLRSFLDKIIEEMQ